MICRIVSVLFERGEGKGLRAKGKGLRFKGKGTRAQGKGPRAKSRDPYTNLSVSSLYRGNFLSADMSCAP